MKRMMSFVLLAAVIITLSGCEPSFVISGFDTDIESVVDVVTVSDYDLNYYSDIYYAYRESVYLNENTLSDKKSFYSVSKYRKAERITEFKDDEIDIYTASPGAYDSYIGKGVNFFAKKELYDIDGKDVEMTPVLSDIMEMVAGIENDIMLMQILKDGDEFFVYTELNVNWWSPCVLYYYDQGSKSLRELYTFDNERIIGLRVRNLDLIRN